jgi:anthranilate synthase component 1
MIQFDIGRDEFTALAEAHPGRRMIQMMAEVPAGCTPLQLYSLIHERPYSYLLESVEKESRHARYSFVGSSPDFVFSVRGRTVSIEYASSNTFIQASIENLEKACENCEHKSGAFTGVIKEGFHPLDAVRVSFVTSEVPLLNGKRFGKQTFLGGAVGYLGYDLIYECLLGQPMPFESSVPDAVLMFCRETFLFDHLEGRIYIVLTPFLDDGGNPAAVYDQMLLKAGSMQEELEQASTIMLRPVEDDNPVSELVACSMGREAFEDAVRRAREYVYGGDVFQLVISRRCDVRSEDSSFRLYRKLRDINPSPYMYMLDLDGTGIIGASPETLMSVFRRRVSTNPIAGTCKRGDTEEEDLAYASAMLEDEKEKAEHVMLVDLSRNDVRRVSKGGSVKVEDFMKVVRYSHVQHIESTVAGDLRSECDQFDAIVALMPAGTLSGAPKLRALELIRDIEGAARGAYGGGVGYFSWNGDLDLAITIRTIIKQGNLLSIQAGAGIVADSDPASEYRETENKMAAMLKTVGVR